jgi:cytochrome c553
MNKLSNLALACCAGLAVLTFTGSAIAGTGKITANVTNGKKIFEEGKPDTGVAACSSCHGENAMGLDAMGSPRLANVGYAYIVKQLTNFADGTRTDATMGVMNDIAKGLTEQERRDLAAYENSFPRASEPSNLAELKAGGTPVGQSYLGQILVRYGVKDKVSACQTCHGFNGRGADPIYPKIEQQKYVYLVNQLTHWRDGSRANDPLGQMRAIAKHLSDEDINNVAAFLSQAADTTPGGGMEINNQTVMDAVKVVK